MGTACYVKQADEIVALLEKEYGVKPGETTPDGKLSVATARCLGSCGLAPILVVDTEVLGKETAESTLKYVKALLAGELSNGKKATMPAITEDEDELEEVDA
jgi:bidirectional [NiFe] hydrogenase diaphorase subunit